MVEENTSRKEITSAPEQTATRTPRKRSMTTLNLQWLAERARKARDIKEAVAKGTYKVDSRKVARALLCIDQEEE